MYLLKLIYIWPSSYIYINYIYIILLYIRNDLINYFRKTPLEKITPKKKSQNYLLKLITNVNIAESRK